MEGAARASSWRRRGTGRLGRERRVKDDGASLFLSLTLSPSERATLTSPCTPLTQFYGSTVPGVDELQLLHQSDEGESPALFAGAMGDGAALVTVSKDTIRAYDAGASTSIFLSVRALLGAD